MWIAVRVEQPQRDRKDEANGHHKTECHAHILIIGRVDGIEMFALLDVAIVA